MEGSDRAGTHQREVVPCATSGHWGCRDRALTTVSKYTRCRPRSTSMHRLATIDVDRLPGHEIARGRGQEHDGADEVGGHLHAFDGATGNAGGQIISR